MTCKLDHSDDGAIPAFLCRQCCPGLIPTMEDNEKFFADLRAREAKQRAIDANARGIKAVEARLKRMGARPIEPGSVSEKIYRGLERKLERLVEDRDEFVSGQSARAPIPG